MNFRIFFTSLGLISSSLATPFTMESAVERALRQNAELNAARWSIKEAEGRVLQSGRRSNPTIDLESRPQLNGRQNSFELGFSQKFPLTNRLRLEKTVSQAEHAVAISEVAMAERKLAAAVRTNFTKLLSLQAEAALHQELITTSQELAGVVKKIAAAGEASSLEAAQLDLEAQQVGLQILQLESERAGLMGELRQLLGLNPKDELALNGSLKLPPAEQNREPNLAKRADYQAALARATAAQQAVALAKANRWEDLEIGLTAAFEREVDQPEGLENNGFVGVKFSLPLPFWNKNQGSIAEATAKSHRMELETKALAAAIQAEAATAWAEMQAARRILTETADQLLPKARTLESQFLNA
jgi:outer membrane protein, heavy metal efflux system